ncbi:unnamed protein product [Ectocarpus fasciculatus]
MVDPAVRQHLHRDVLHPHVAVGIHVLLRLRLRASGVRHPGGGAGLHDHRGGVFRPQRGELSLAVGFLLKRSVYRWLRFPVLWVLLVVQDTPEWLHADLLLLRIHGTVLRGTRSHVWLHRRHGQHRLRKANLPQHQSGLTDPCHSDTIPYHMLLMSLLDLVLLVAVDSSLCIQ